MRLFGLGEDLDSSEPTVPELDLAARCYCYEWDKGSALVLRCGVLGALLVICDVFHIDPEAELDLGEETRLHPFEIFLAVLVLLLCRHVEGKNALFEEQVGSWLPFELEGLLELEIWHLNLFGG